MELNLKMIITYGTYDLSHHGHLAFLRRAKAVGDVLIVGLSTDHFIRLNNQKVPSTALKNLRRFLSRWLMLIA